MKNLLPSLSSVPRRTVLDLVLLLNHVAVTAGQARSRYDALLYDVPEGWTREQRDLKSGLNHKTSRHRMNYRLGRRGILAFALSLSIGCWLRAAPIHDAASAGDVASVRVMLAYDPTLLEARSSQGVTPLIWAAQNGRLEVVEFLLYKGAVVDARADNAVTPLFIAAQNGCFEIVEMLLAKGAAVDARDNLGSTPLMMAAWNGWLGIVERLLEKGAAVNTSANNGATPLMMAAVHGRLGVVKLLLEKGAAVDATDRTGGTPLNWATRSGSFEVVKLLLEKGAPWNAMTQNGATPFMVAAENWYPHEATLAPDSGAEARPPPHPTEIFSIGNGRRLRVVGVSGKKPEVVADGKTMKVKPDGDFAFARANGYAPGKVEIKNTLREYSGMQHRDSRGKIGSVVDMGVNIYADLVPQTSYSRCYFVLVLFDESYLNGLTDDSHTAFFFREIGRLDAGQKKEIRVDVDAEKEPSQLACFFLVFSEGLEIESNQADLAAAFFRRGELIEHRKRLAAWFGEKRLGDCPPRAYVVVAPVLPMGVVADGLPNRIDASCTISVDGLVEGVELPGSIPAVVAAEVSRAVAGCLFLPRIEHGVPRRTRVQIPIALRNEGAEH